MQWLVGGSEIVAGVTLFIGWVFLILFLRPPQGTLQERLIISFPGAWIIVGLPMAMMFGVSIALVATGIGVLR
jgi:hypothetical protein